jgi:hypothetical protein
MQRKTYFQLRQEHLNRLAEELDPELIRRLTGHKVSTWNPAYVYDNPDLKKLRSRTPKPRLTGRALKNRPS